MKSYILRSIRTKIFVQDPFIAPSTSKQQVPIDVQNCIPDDLKVKFLLGNDNLCS